MKRTATIIFLAIVSLSLKAPPMYEGEAYALYARTQYEKHLLYEAEVHRAEQFEMFLESLGFSESSHNPAACNGLGYIGLYQMGKAARKATGYGHITDNAFRRNPDIWPPEQQRAAMEILIHMNNRILHGEIQEYSGKVVRGVLVTKSGILAAAHIAGAGGVKRWLNAGINPRDAFGTSLTDYMVKFGGYEF